MKDEYLKAYQRKVDEIKELDVSTEEKRVLAANAKEEILNQYKQSYKKDDENKNDNSSTIENKDPIDNILNKFEEREERGEVGIQLQESSEFLSPDNLFATMDLDDLLSDVELGEDGDEDESEFLDGDELLASILEDFDDFDPSLLDEEFNIDDYFSDLNIEDDQLPQSNLSDFEQEEKNDLEVDVLSVEEINEGQIIDEQIDDEELLEIQTESIKELEKEREKVQKLGIVEVILLIILIILICIVIYLTIGV